MIKNKKEKECFFLNYSSKSLSLILYEFLERTLTYSHAALSFPNKQMNIFQKKTNNQPASPCSSHFLSPASLP